MYQHFPFQGAPKYTQIGIFGLKINHLATLARTPTQKKFLASTKRRFAMLPNNCNVAKQLQVRFNSENKVQPGANPTTFEFSATTPAL
jgi:hypothetical protein